MFIYILSILIVLLLAYLVSKNFGKKNLPPGPWGLPFVGYSPFLGKNPILKLTNLRKKYGNVMQVPLGIRPVIFLNDYEAMKEAFVKQGDIFSGRPDIFIPKTIFENKDIIFSDGPSWRLKRRFSMQTLRDFGVGRTSLEAIVMEQVDTLTKHLTTKNGKLVDMNNLFFVPIMNIIWGICAGKTFEINDERINSFKEVFNDFSKLGNWNIVNFLPMVRHVIPGGFGYHKIKRTTQKIKQFLREELENHIQNFQKTNMKDFIDYFLAKIYESEDSGQEITDAFSKSNLVGTIFNLFIAGSDTTTTTLAWGMLYIASRPDIQRKVQKELDKHVSIDSYMSLASKTLLPYTEATLLEIQRFATITPLGVPHRTTKDTTLMGYDIPANTTVYANIYAVHHDQQYWEDPDVFRPERFLDESGETVQKHEHLVPFSAGPRQCLGESLAKLEMFLFFTSLLRRFSFEMNPDQPKPSEKPVVGTILKPQPFSCIINCR